MIYDRQGDKMTSRNTEQSMADESRQNIEQAKRGVKQGKDIAKKIDNHRKNQAGKAADKANSSAVNPAKKAKENLAKNTGKKASEKGAEEVGKQAGKQVAKEAAKQAGKEVTKQGVKTAASAAAGSATAGVATVAIEAASLLKESVENPHKLLSIFFFIFILPIVIIGIIILPIIAVLFVLFPNLLSNTSSKQNGPVAMQSMIYQTQDEKTKNLIEETLEVDVTTYVASKNAKKQQPIYDENDKLDKEQEEDSKNNKERKPIVNENSDDIKGEGYMGDSIYLYEDAAMTKKVTTVQPGQVLTLSKDEDYDGGKAVPINAQTLENGKNSKPDEQDTIENDGISNPGKDTKEYTVLYANSGNLVKKDIKDPNHEYTIQDEYDVITVSMVNILNNAKSNSEEKVNQAIQEQIKNYDKYGEAVQKNQGKESKIYASLKSDSVVNNTMDSIANFFSFGGYELQKRKKSANSGSVMGAIDYSMLDINPEKSNIDPTLDGFDVAKSYDESEGGVDADGTTEQQVSRITAAYATSKSDTVPDRGYYAELDRTIGELVKKTGEIESKSLEAFDDYRIVPTYIEGEINVPKIEHKEYYYYVDNKNELTGYDHYYLSPDRVIDYSKLDSVDYDTYNTASDSNSEYAYILAKDATQVPDGAKANVVLTSTPIKGRKDGKKISAPVVERTVKYKADGKKPIPVKYPFKNYYLRTELGDYSTVKAEQQFFAKSEYYKHRLEGMGVDPNSDWFDTGDVEKKGKKTEKEAKKQALDKFLKEMSGVGKRKAEKADNQIGRAQGTSFNLANTEMGQFKPYISKKKLKGKTADAVKKNAVQVGNGLLQVDGYYLISAPKSFGDVGNTLQFTVGENVVKAIIVTHRSDKDIDPISQTSLKDGSYFDFIVDDDYLTDEIKAAGSYSDVFEGPVSAINNIEYNGGLVQANVWRMLMSLPYYSEVLSYVYADSNATYYDEQGLGEGWIEGEKDEYGYRQFFLFPKTTSDKEIKGMRVYSQGTLPEFYKKLLPKGHEKEKLIVPVPNFGTQSMSPTGAESDGNKVLGFIPWFGYKQEYRRSMNTEQIKVTKVKDDGSTEQVDRVKTIEDKILEWTENIRKHLITNEQLAGEAGNAGINMGALLEAEIGNAGGKKYKEYKNLDTNLVTTDKNAWSAAFVQYMLNQANAKDKTKDTTSVSEMWNHHSSDIKPNDKSYEPKVGDMVFIKEGGGAPSKVELISKVEKKEDGTISVTSIGGNVDGSGARNNNNEWLGVVGKRDFNVGDSQVAGFVSLGLSQGGGAGGSSVDANGKGSGVTGYWTDDNLPQQYRDSMSLPAFQPPNWGSSPFAGGLAGQCTEFTWAYMSQLYGQSQPTMGNGVDVYQSYQAGGATITDKPTVGYGFSATNGYAGALTGYGHTGVCVAVYEDGSWLAANFNGPNELAAPSRRVWYTLIDGASPGQIHFFSGIGNANFSGGGVSAKVNNGKGGIKVKQETKEQHIANAFATAIDQKYDILSEFGDKSYRYGIGQWTDSELGSIFKIMKEKNEEQFKKAASESNKFKDAIISAGETGEFSTGKISLGDARGILKVLITNLGKKAQKAQLEKEAKDILKDVEKIEGAKLDVKTTVYLASVVLIQKRFSNDLKVDMDAKGLQDAAKGGGDINKVHKSYYRENKEIFEAYNSPNLKGPIFEFDPVDKNQSDFMIRIINQSIIRAKKYAQSLTEAKVQGGAAGTLEGSTDHEKVWKFLKAQGFSDAAAAAFMGNMMEESGIQSGRIQSDLDFNAGWAYNPSINGYAFGLIQWDGGRRVNLLNAAKEKGVDWKDLAFQLEFLMNEMQTSEASSFSGIGGLDGFKKGTNVAELTTYFRANVERGGFGTDGKRIASAQEILNLYGGKN